MDPLKLGLQRKLIASILSDRLKQSEHLVFREAWCTQERVLRFTTHFFRELLLFVPDERGRWKTGDCVMYEVHNDSDTLTVQCILSMADVPAGARINANALLQACTVSGAQPAAQIVLKSWDLTRIDGDINKTLEAFDALIQLDIPAFERELRRRVDAILTKQAALTEGKASESLSSKYERNPAARAACLAYHGRVCAVCGMDFEKTYGPDFAGIIEVHHIVPISEIGESYVVDPIKDLVPVCPNCHTALHSKKGGVYTVEELRKTRYGER